MAELYDTAAPKKAANLSVNSDLLRKTRDLNINLSATTQYPYLVDIQSGLLTDLAARIVIPVGYFQLLRVTPQISSVPENISKNPSVPFHISGIRLSRHWIWQPLAYKEAVDWR